MITFTYEYAVLDTYDLNPLGIQKHLNNLGKDGWVVNCSVGTNLVLSKMQMKYTVPEGTVSKEVALRAINRHVDGK